jgi:hypothetical protein
MSFAASTKLLIESKGILQSRFVIPVVISDKRILLLKHEHFTKAEVDSSAIKRTISEYKEADQVLLEPGIQKKVHEWVLRNKDFKGLEAIGLASVIA